MSKKMIPPETTKDLHREIINSNRRYFEAEDKFRQATHVARQLNDLHTMIDHLHTIVMCVNGKIDKLSDEIVSLAMQR